MASYLPPLNTSTTFNVSDYDYQDESATLANTVLTTTTQSINGSKTFQSVVTMNAGASISGNVSQTSGNITTAGNLTANGNTTIGDNNADTCTIKALTSFTNSALPTTTASSTTTGNDILNRTLMDSRYPQTSGTNSFSGSNTFSTLTIPQSVSVTSSGNNTMVIGNTAQTGNTHTNSMYMGYQVINGANAVAQTLDKNTVIGYQAWGTGVPSRTGAQAQENTFVGYQAGKTATTAGRCTFVGSASGSAVTSSTGSIGVGRSALLSLTSGNNNTGIGSTALQQLTTGSNNVAVGLSAGSGSGFITTANCTFLGANAASTVNALDHSCAIGADATVANSNQITLGRSTESVIIPYLTTTGVTGTTPLYTDANGVLTKTAPTIMIEGVTAQTGNTHTNGYYAGYQVINAQAGQTIDKCTSVGYQSNGNASGAVTNSAFYGYRSGYNVTGTQNTMIGSQAGTGVNGSSTGGSNTFLGFKAGFGITSGQQNNAIGNSTLQNTTTGTDNTAQGAFAMQVNTTGSINTALGSSAGSGSGMLSNSNCTFLGYFAQSSSNGLDHATAIGADSTVNASNTIVLGRSSGTYDAVRCPILTQTGVTGVVSVYADANGNITKTSSDQRLKENIADLNVNDCLTHINELTPKSFTWKANPEYGTDYGVIAQEVLNTSLAYLVRDNGDAPKDENGVPIPGEANYKSFCYEKLIIHLVGSIKCLTTKVNALENQLNSNP